MTPSKIFEHLEAKGISLSLNLKLEAKAKPTEVLLAYIADNRDAFIKYLAQQQSLKTYGPAFITLMLWAAKFGDLRLEHPNGVILNPQPRHISDARAKHSWGIIYGESNRVIAKWGDVPKQVSEGKVVDP